MYADPPTGVFTEYPEGAENVTEYEPDPRPTNAYSPFPLVVAASGAPLIGLSVTPTPEANPSPESRAPFAFVSNHATPDTVAGTSRGYRGSRFRTARRLVGGCPAPPANWA
ncbi:MAG TPA: hypothetical protein VGE74_22045 [Gemmata sp.]